MSATPTASSNRIARRFAELDATGRPAFIVYICAGDPDLETTARLVPALAEAGADIIELGIPYTDPMADGPANQAASERALASGTTVSGVLDCVREIRQHSDVPMLFFTYLNPVLAYGVERFAQDAAVAGADGILPLDLPYEQDAGFLRSMRAAGLANVCLAAPNTREQRRLALAKQSRGFLYYVCRLGVTGERDALPEDLGERVAVLKSVSSAPVCIGFGISSPEQAAEAARYGDGVIIGSHLVRMIERHGEDPDLVKLVADRVRVLADAVHGVTRS